MLLKNGIREKSVVSYHTTLPVIFGVKKYAESLMKVVKERFDMFDLNFSSTLKA